MKEQEGTAHTFATDLFTTAIEIVCVPMQYRSLTCVFVL